MIHSFKVSWWVRNSDISNNNDKNEGVFVQTLLTATITPEG